MKKLFSVLLCLMMAVFTLPVYAEVDASLTMSAASDKEMTVYLHYNHILLGVEYSDGDDTHVTTWTSSDPDIISVRGLGVNCDFFVHKAGGPVTITAESEEYSWLSVEFKLTAVDEEPDLSLYEETIGMGKLKVDGSGTENWQKNPESYDFVCDQTYVIGIGWTSSLCIPQYPESELRNSVEETGLLEMTDRPQGGGMTERDRTFFSLSFEVRPTKAGKGILTIGKKNNTVALNVLFKDVADSGKYFFEPVYWALENNITTGSSAIAFSPNQNVTRGQMVTFLWRLAGSPEPSSPADFKDVDANKYYANAIAWAAENKITTGYAGTNKFGPDDKCTREQIVSFLWRYAGSPEPAETAEFTDTKPNAYYLNALSWASEKGITKGLNDGTGRFGVGQSCTRAMCVTFLHRYNKSINVEVK